MQRPVTIGLLLAATLVSGLWLSGMGKPLNPPLSVLHKTLALALVIFVAIWLTHAGQSIGSRTALATVIVLSAAILTAFASGILLSIPSVEGPAWLLLHRIAAVLATIAAAATVPFLMLKR